MNAKQLKIKNFDAARDGNNTPTEIKATAVLSGQRNFVQVSQANTNSNSNKLAVNNMDI